MRYGIQTSKASRIRRNKKENNTDKNQYIRFDTIPVRGEHQLCTLNTDELAIDEDIDEPASNDNLPCLA